MNRLFRSPSRRSQGKGIVLALATVLLLPTALSATTVLPLDDDQLVDQSSLIVVGTCDVVHHEWRQGLLMTLATIRVDRVLKGAPVSRVTVLIAGGTDFDRPVPVAVTVPGAPSIVPSERVLLYLEPAGTDRWQADGGARRHRLLPGQALDPRRLER